MAAIMIAPTDVIISLFRVVYALHSYPVSTLAEFGKKRKNRPLAFPQPFGKGKKPQEPCYAAFPLCFGYLLLCKKQVILKLSSSKQ